jgi:hypothetical protein
MSCQIFNRAVGEETIGTRMLRKGSGDVAECRTGGDIKKGAI